MAPGDVSINRDEGTVLRYVETYQKMELFLGKDWWKQLLTRSTQLDRNAQRIISR